MRSGGEGETALQNECKYQKMEKGSQREKEKGQDDKLREPGWSGINLGWKGEERKALRTNCYRVILSQLSRTTEGHITPQLKAWSGSQLL